MKPAPGFSRNEHGHRLSDHTKVSGDGRVSITSERAANGRQGLLLCEDSRAAHLQCAIAIVVGLSAFEKVIGSNAGRDVAMVKDMGFRHVARTDEPRNAVRQFHLAVQAKLPIQGATLAVTEAGLPQPAPVSLIDLFPETCESLFVHGNTHSFGSGPDPTLQASPGPSLLHQEAA